MPNYADPPARRKAYDRDDTIVTAWWTGLSGVYDHSAAGHDVDLNDEDDDLVLLANVTVRPIESAPVYLAFVFTDQFKLTAVKLMVQVGGTGVGVTSVDIEYSEDTTNGRDGTWVTIQTGIAFDMGDPGEPIFAARPRYRESIQAVGDTAARKSYRFKINATGTLSGLSFSIKLAHLYGTEPEEPADRLSFRLSGADTEVASDIDFGDIARGETKTQQFRVKNLSAGLTANDVTVTSEQGPSFGDLTTFTLVSLNDIDYFASINLGNLGPGVLSAIFYVRAVVPAAHDLSTFSARLSLSTSSYA